MSALALFHARTRLERQQRTVAQRQTYATRRAEGGCGRCGVPTKNRAYCTACAGVAAAKGRLKLIGVTDAQYQAALLAQNGRCAICRVSQSRLKKALAADHNRQTGAFRGLLCSRCNLGIGLFRDQPNVLRAAMRYVDRT